MKNNRPLKIGIVVAEHSGEMLALDAMKSILKVYPDAMFYGIGGSEMQKQPKFNCWYDKSQITAMGVSQYIKVYRNGRKILLDILARFADEKTKIDCFIGIDAPAFNIPLAKRLTKKMPNVVNICYVSPTFWAWAYKRIFKVMRYFKAVLCVYFFEIKTYKKYNFPAFYVGHPVSKKNRTNLNSCTG